MEILKEEEIYKHRCPKCQEPLYYERKELKKKYTFLQLLFGEAATGNEWFSCDNCKVEYLIKDDVKEVQDE